MTIKELKERLSQLDENMDIVVVDFTQKTYIGSTPTLDIDSVNEGFDWDSGKIFIHLKHKEK